MSYFFFFLIFEFILLILFKLYEHSKYMTIYLIRHLWNFGRFPDCRNLLILEIEQFQKFDYFMNSSIMEFWRFSKLLSFGHFFEFEKLKHFWNFPSWKINKFPKFFECEKPKFWSKNWKFFKLFVHSIFRTIFISCFSDSRKFDGSTFERSSIFKFETSAIFTVWILNPHLIREIWKHHIKFF